eukprot:GHRQ01033172.1.p1 GENE.GHRQ01033172.1~~GHRQ01033172.1.p1  ORF type:complete len:156 (+),score=55.51 GHRQ01033172.1:1068-1535(+)
MDDDLLLRMSKKIAQLTKVIYHLNNKNEDCEFDKQELAEKYEIEIEQVLKDSAAKIDAITEQLRQQEASQRQEAAVLEALTTRFDEQSRKDQALIQSQAQALSEKDASVQALQGKEAALQQHLSQLQKALQDKSEELQQQARVHVLEKQVSCCLL